MSNSNNQIIYAARNKHGEWFTGNASYSYTSNAHHAHFSNSVNALTLELIHHNLNPEDHEIVKFGVVS